jgi:hypothetical protein
VSSESLASVTQPQKPDTLLSALGLTPYETKEKNEKISGKRKQILEQLEKGEITAEEAKRKLGVLN